MGALAAASCLRTRGESRVQSNSAERKRFYRYKRSYLNTGLSRKDWKQEWRNSPLLFIAN